MPKIYNAPPGMEMNPIGYAAELRALRAALAEYANPLNWAVDSSGLRRVWMEPGSTTPDAYNGFEAAQAALAPKGTCNAKG